MKQLLITKFSLVGDLAQMPAYQQMLIRGYGLNPAEHPIANQHVNPTVTKRTSGRATTDR